MFSKIYFLIISLLSHSYILTSTQIEARIKLTPPNKWEIIYSNFQPSDYYIATAFYTDSLSEIGWDKLSISTNPFFNDEIQAEAAGRLEGALTKDRIFNFYLNLKDEMEITEEISKFFEEQENFVFNAVKGEGENDAMLYNAYLIKKQYNGLIEQYNIVASEEQKLQKNDFNLLNYYPELSDLVQKYKVEKEGPTDYTKMDSKKIFKLFLKRNHCSALFKLKNDFSDVYFGHNTWNTYYSAVRIIKEYNFNFNNRWVRSKNIIFSSYPATLASIDDFYLSSHGLISIETTNSFFNDTLFSLITPNSLFTSERAMICNRISNSSKEWAQNFAKYNSGTYNNQFMILDKNKINLVNKTIDLDAFFIVEQLPGLVRINNVTDILKFGYWSSFNLPFDKEIYEISGIQVIIDHRPDAIPFLDYDVNGRSKIFRRDHRNADNIEGFKKFMRYNKYKSDPYSEGSPSLTIASRDDLDGLCSGAYDAKVGALSDWVNGKAKFHLIGGPTFDIEEGIEPFRWENATEECKNHNHFLIPEEFVFDWVEFEPLFDF